MRYVAYYSTMFMFMADQKKKKNSTMFMFALKFDALGNCTMFSCHSCFATGILTILFKLSLVNIRWRLSLAWHGF